MSKALVIKGANFATNKVETVTLGETVPCTGIELSQSTIEFTAYSSTELSATLTPANTTDTLTWASSDTDVATVSGSGVVTCVGVGTATITATCGEQTATCGVSASIAVDMNNTYHQENAVYRYSGSIDLANNKDWIGLTDSNVSNRRIYYSEDNLLGGYRAFIGASYDGMYLMPIPNGANHIHVTAPSEFTWVAVILADSLTKSQASGSDGECASAVAAPFSNTGNSDPLDIDISSYPTANGYILALTGAADPASVTGDVVVTFSKVTSD